MVRQRDVMHGRIACEQWLVRMSSSVCVRARRVREPTQTLQRAGDSRAAWSGGWEGGLTVVAGAAAGHGARGRCSGVVLHFDDLCGMCGGDDGIVWDGDVRGRFWSGESVQSR